MKAILGKKIGMTRILQERKATPVTLVEAGPCVVLRVKTKESDGYEALQIGYGRNEKFKMSPYGGSSEGRKNEKMAKFRHVKEFRISDGQTHQVGEELSAGLFQEGDTVKISGISKGKGFQGSVKRWGFHGRNATHGAKHEERTVGSTGSQFPQRVIPGRHMPGRTGAERVTIPHVKIVKVDAVNNVIAVKGPIPGRRGTLLEIREV